MTEFNYNDIIEYIDCTYDENFEDAKHWCNENNAQLIELVEKREEKEVEEPDVLDPSKTNKVIKLFRYFQIGEEPIISEPLPPTEEEQRENRANAYQQEVDPITSHIQRLRDMEQTEEIIAEIEQLKLERDAKMEEIKARYPYPASDEEL